MFTISGTQLISSSPVRRKRREIWDVLTRVECFVSYMSVVTAYVLQRSRELLAYMSLILRTARRFGGRAWFEYDRAFRQEAVISGSKDWHIKRADLYNFHTESLCPDRPFVDLTTRPEASLTTWEICRSWNREKCSRKFSSCSYVRHQRMWWRAPQHRVPAQLCSQSYSRASTFSITTAQSTRRTQFPFIITVRYSRTCNNF